MVAIDSTWDVNPDAEAVALLAPYKAKVDSIMYRVVGTAEMSMDKGAPESLLSNLVADIIQLSRLDESNSEVPFEEVDLYELASSVLCRLEAVAGKRGISLTLSGEHATVNGVSQVLDEMVFNLCDNAVKYSRENGHVRVFVSEENGHVALRVEDDGIGIPEKDRERIFDRFYRVDKSHSKKIGGTGLGLSIVKHAAAYHDARIQLDSQLGHGTRVRVLFHPSQEGEGV